MSLLARWNPRRQLSAAIGWSVFAIVALAALAAANLAAAEAERHARADALALLAELATQSQQMLAAGLTTRRLLLQSTAAQIAASTDRRATAMRLQLQAVRAQFPEFAWLGVADDEGRIVAATSDALQGRRMAALAPTAQGRPPSWIVAVQTPAPLVAKAGARAIAIGAGFGAANGQPEGAVGGVLDWDWLVQLQAGMLRALGAQRGIELLLVAHDGEVLAGPASWVGRRLRADDDASEDGRFLVGAAAADAERGEPAWRELVRQPAGTALAPARAAQRAVFGVVLLAGLLAALSAMWVTRRMMRDLRRLARQAEAVRKGVRGSLSQPGGDNEVSRLGETLAALIGALQREKEALTRLNAELDARVAERSARVEQLAAESRDAAVTRERLRLARELHDTLAHSLMALLTQIRLVRKLRPRLDAAALDAELAQAETAATDGLAEARAAIAQIRGNPVRDAGLGVALQALALRMGERSGIEVSFGADAPAAALADARAETLYRIADEALRNVERHAGARHVMLRLDWQPAGAGEGAAPARIGLTIADDGVGFDPVRAYPGHFGLQGMQEQAGLIGAHLAVRGGEGGGTRVELTLDVDAMPSA
jgi:signal transduction histidine kinase